MNVTIDGPARYIKARSFSIAVPGDPCQRWSDGRHIVVAEDNYRCKCGKQFLLLEIDPE